MSDDNDLKQRLVAHDAVALGEFFRVKRGPLLAFIERQLGTALRRRVEPEDVLQEASAEALRSLPGTDLSQRDPLGWLCQIAERKIIDLHRRHFGAQKRDAGREVPLGTPGGDSHSPGLINMLVLSMTTPSKAFSRNARELRLANAIAELPLEQQEALRMRYAESLPSKEIAEKLGKTDAAVRVMLTRSLKKLQELLRDDAPGPT